MSEIMAVMDILLLILLGVFPALVIVGGIAWLRTDPFGSLDATPPKGGNPAGAGVVADSDPESEWQETLAKARAMTRAVELAHGG